jgi:hypothetical protein
MINKISIQGFKSIRNISDLELGLVNVFIGANGSGKSNLLEAIGVLGAAISGRVDDQTLLQRGVRPGIPALYKTSLKGQKIRSTITLEAAGKWQNEQVDYKVSLDNPIEKPETNWRYVTENLTRNGKKIVSYSPRGKSFVSGLSTMSTEILSLRPHSGMVAFIQGYKELDGAPRELISVLNDYVVFSPITSVLRGIQTDPGQREPIGLYGGRLPEAVEDILDKQKGKLGKLDLDNIFDLLDWVSDFDIVPPSRQFLSSSVPSLRRVIRFKDNWMLEKRGELSGYDASEGALYVLFMLTLALHPNAPRIFAIDNFDQAMHPRLARALARLFAQQILASDTLRQVLITTHNPLVLDGLNLQDERIRLFAVERDTQGATKVHRIQVSDEILQASQDGLSLSNLWVMGRLGGVPDLF